MSEASEITDISMEDIEYSQPKNQSESFDMPAKAVRRPDSDQTSSSKYWHAHIQRQFLDGAGNFNTIQKLDLSDSQAGVSATSQTSIEAVERSCSQTSDHELLIDSIVLGSSVCIENAEIELDLSIFGSTAAELSNDEALQISLLVGDSLAENPMIAVLENRGTWNYSGRVRIKILAKRVKSE